VNVGADICIQQQPFDALCTVLVIWKSARFKPSDYRPLPSHKLPRGIKRLGNDYITGTNHGQCGCLKMLNHFPKSGVITRKDCLVRTIRKMKVTHDDDVQL